MFWYTPYQRTTASISQNSISLRLTAFSQHHPRARYACTDMGSGHHIRVVLGTEQRVKILRLLMQAPQGQWRWRRKLMAEYIAATHRIVVRVRPSAALPSKKKKGRGMGRKPRLTGRTVLSEGK
jgi:hypothetical protein